MKVEYKYVDFNREHKTAIARVEDVGSNSYRAVNEFGYGKQALCVTTALYYLMGYRHIVTWKEIA